MTAQKTYDEKYFDRWYRNPRTRVTSLETLARKVRLTVGITEYLLERPIRTVLDIGCGEGLWFSLLRRLRPKVRYTGIDPSEYVVRRFGARRHIRRGSFAELPTLRLPSNQDLIICSDVLQYVSDAELKRGLQRIHDLLGGVAYLEAYTTDDDMVGDMIGWQHRPTEFFRRAFRDAGFTACGMHCYASNDLASNMLAMERCPTQFSRGT